MLREDLQSKEGLPESDVRCNREYGLQQSKSREEGKELCEQDQAR